MNFKSALLVGALAMGLSASAFAAPTGIAANKIGVETNKATIEKLDKTMQKGFAMQSALSGLVQPCASCKGKFFASTALGGYNGQQAVAVGSGYTFNNNVTVKAAVATNFNEHHDVAYHVGAGVTF